MGDDNSADEEPEKADFEALMEKMEARREEQREQVSFDWCETIRRAGELFRELEEIESVADKLDRSEEAVREALTVYRLIFEDPPGTVATKASRPGRVFFTLDKDIEEVDPDGEEEPVQHLVREYVGAVYLEYDVDEELVNRPVKGKTPTLPGDLEKFTGLSETIAENLTFPTGAIVASSGFNRLRESLLPLQAELMETAMQPMLDQPSQLIEAMHPLAIEQIRSQQMSPPASAIESISSSLTSIELPEPVVADLASLQPAINGAAVSSLPPSVESSTVPEASTSTTDADQGDPTIRSLPSVESAVGATVDATQPDRETFSTELIFELPALIVESILSAGQTRTWFTSLPYEHQITVVNVMLVSATLSVTGNPALAALAPIIAPSVRKMIVEGEE